MHILKVRGGNRLAGEVDVTGSKNATLALLSSIPLIDGEVLLHNVPDVTDVQIKLKLLEDFGAVATWHEGSLLIDSRQIHRYEPFEASIRPIRTSFYLLGPLLARLGRARLPLPGGCKIGARPVDYHIKGLEMLGATIQQESGCYIAEGSNLRGTEIYLDFPSAGATQHLMATATLLEGVTVIQNAALEPEVVTLAEFLNRAGARIEGAGTSTITITGVDRLGSCEYRVPADRLQAGTYLLAGAITGGDVTVRGLLPEHQTALVNKLRESGLEAMEGADWIRVKGNQRPRGIRIRTMPYPGFPTDMQQPMSALLALANGMSVVEETIYESRIGHVQELNRMGAKLHVEGRTVVIEGVNQLQAAVVEASDLRAGAALVLASLVAEGESVIKNVHFIDRGYEQIEDILTQLGASIERMDLNEWESQHAATK